MRNVLCWIFVGLVFGGLVLGSSARASPSLETILNDHLQEFITLGKFVEMAATSDNNETIIEFPSIDIYIPIGDTAKAPIKTKSTKNVSSWKAGFRFNPYILECIDFTEGSYLSDVGTTIWTAGTIDNVNGIVTSYNCALEAGKSQKGTGVLAYVRFRVKNYGKTVIDLTDKDGDPCECMVLDPDGNEVPLILIDGEVTFREPVVGGIAIPVDKFGLLAPYIGLASTIVVATVATAIYVKRRKKKQ